MFSCKKEHNYLKIGSEPEIYSNACVVVYLISEFCCLLFPKQQQIVVVELEHTSIFLITVFYIYFINSIWSTIMIDKP